MPDTHTEPISEDSVPEGLVAAIRNNRCIAFIGAGFSAAAKLPSWKGLLTALTDDYLPGAESANAEISAYIKDLLNETKADRNEEAAQLIQDAIGREAFINALRQELCGQTPGAQMKQRLTYLRGIPLRAALTTNFDDMLEGHVPSNEVFRKALQGGQEPAATLLQVYRRLSASGGPLTIKIHGDLHLPHSVVFSRLDYRRRLYTDAAYLAFLRAVFLNYTILYLGVSFTDAYLNELRSESLAILGGLQQNPLAYAVMNDVPLFTREHYLKNEGIQILNYDTTTDKEHTGCDRWLKRIHDATNPLVQFGKLLKGKRILWVDPNRPSIEHLVDGFFVETSRQAGHKEYAVDMAASAEEALDTLKQKGGVKTYALVISHWGHVPHGKPTAQRLLAGMRTQEYLCVPTLIFSIREHANERKPLALGWGAQGYHFTNEGLLRGIERVLKPGLETG